MITSRTDKGARRWWYLLVAGVIVLGLAVLLFRPVSFAGLSSDPNPARDYAEAMRRIDANGGLAFTQSILELASLLVGVGLVKSLFSLEGDRAVPVLQPLQQFLDILGL